MNATMTDMTVTLVILVIGVAFSCTMAFLVFLFWKSRPFATGDVFVASRLSTGNRLFPTQVLITPSSVVHHTARWIGHHEQSIHMAHVASVRIDTRFLFSDVLIETTGGVNAIQCRGHRKKDAIEMKRLIEAHQSVYYSRRDEGRGEPRI
jgi:hypothetical protein